MLQIHFLIKIKQKCLKCCSENKIVKNVPFPQDTMF